MLILISILIFGGFLFFYVGYRNTFDVKQRKIDIQFHPPIEKKLNILHLSDMHMERISVRPKDSLLGVKDVPIDLIAITGDLVERKKNIALFMEYISELKKLNPPLGIYVVFGNNDYNLGKHIHFLRQTLEDQGCIVMQNENKIIPLGSKTLTLIGIDNYSTGHANISKAYTGVGKGYKLVLTHDPNVILKMDEFPFDYLLAGHFHGGQIHWPKPYHMVKYGEVARMKMITGLHYYNERPFYISEGLGQSGLKLRIGTRPEITLHTIK